VENKKFLNNEQLIDRLVDKGIVVSNRDEVKRILLDYGYSNITMYYRKPFYCTNTKKYDENLDLNDIKNLIEFDLSLKQIFIAPTLKLEMRIKSIMGSKLDAFRKREALHFLDRVNFDPRHTSKLDYYTVIRNIKTAVYTNRKLFHEFDSFESIPPWTLSNHLPIGLVVSLYDFMFVENRKEILKDFDKNNVGMDHQDLEKYLRILVDLRNTIFHSTPLYDHKFTNFTMSSHKFSTNRFMINDKLALLAPIITLFEVLSGSITSDSIKSKIFDLLNEYKKKVPTEISNKVLKEMIYNE